MSWLLAPLLFVSDCLFEELLKSTNTAFLMFNRLLLSILVIIFDILIETAVLFCVDFLLLF